ncbi:SusC/RagA family TonB-linked outer membrane protein, partial [Flavobacterium branchiophilum]
MKLKLKGILALFLVLITQLTFAQDRTVSGVVSDASGLPIPTANVKVKGTTNGVQTDFDGKYKIKANASDVLVFSYVGMKAQEVKATSTTINVKLASDANELNQVVVTAMGIKREKKSLGYATQEVKGSDLNAGAGSGNFLNELSGKVSGVAIRRNNNFGGSTNVVSRGIKSLTGNNQMLIVVDGMPINNQNVNSNTGAQTTGRGTTYDYGNAAMDINPDDVENVNILKGAAASALYGYQAGNGVILITTKKGKTNKNGGMGVTIASEFITGGIDKSTFPVYQDQYGSGYGLGTSFLGTSPIDTVDTSNDGSYGDPFDGHLVYQWNAFTPYSSNYGKATPWVAAKNGPITFFQTPTSFSNSLSLENGDDKSSFVLNYNNFKQNGIMPNSEMKKNSLSAKVTHIFNDKFSTTIFANFVIQNTTGRNSTGYNDNIMGTFRQWWQTNTDVKELKEVFDNSNGQNITWNWANPTTAAGLKPIYWDNPYFTRYKSYQNDERNRFIGYAKLDYKINNWLTATGKIATDSYSEIREERRANGSVAAEFGIERLKETSGYQKYNRTFSEQNYDLLLTFKKDFSKDFSFNGVVGGTVKKTKANYTLASTKGGLIVPNLFSLLNGNAVSSPLESESYNTVNSYFGTLSFGYKDFIFLDATARRDAFSTLAKGLNTITTKALSASYVFSNNIKAPWLNFGKLRASYAENPQGQINDFSLFDTYTKNTAFGSNQLYSVPSTKNNPNLSAVRTETKEIGLEVQLLDRRLGFDISAYKSLSRDQIFPVSYSTSTGYSSRYVNAGSVQNKGIEVQMNITPIKTKDFQWEMFLNWSVNRNTVVSLNEGISNLQLGSFQGGVTINATVGEPYGTIMGTDFIYLNGQKVVGTNGIYLKNSNTNNVIGNVTPDWIGGVRNKFTYKNISAGFLIDMQKGGDIFSLDQSYGLDTGLYDITVGTNHLGNPIRNSIANGGGIILPGVQADGSANTVRAANSDVYGIYGYEANPNKAFIYDASYIKLREANITYTLPSKYTSKMKISELKFSIIGSNLWIIHKNLPYADPESGLSSGNLSSGYSAGSLPTTRNIGCNLTLI